MRSAILGTGALFAVVAFAATGAGAQQSPVERLRGLATRGPAAALLDAVREHPDDARELVRLLILEAGPGGPPAADSALALARRLGRTYAVAWADSFPLASVERFARMPAATRAAKLAADSVRLAGNTALGRAGTEPALALWREALRRSMAIDDSAGIAAALGNIGAGFSREDRHDSAEVHLGRARALAEAVGDRRTAANAVVNLGSVAMRRGDLRRAQMMYAGALDLYERIGDVRGTVAAHNNLALLAADLAEWSESRARYEQALSMARRHRLDGPAATALVGLGNAASTDGEYAEAARHYAEALSIHRAEGREADAALVLHNLGLLALRRGDYAVARARLVDALAIFSRTGTTADLVRVRRDLAAVSAAAGDLRQALDQLGRAEQALGRDAGDIELAADVALTRADLALHFNDLAEAERQYARAEVLYRRARLTTGQTEAQQGRAMLLVERRQFGAALELLRAVERTQTATGDRRAAALTRMVVGYALQRRGDVSAARRALAQAADSLRALGDVAGEAAALAAVGDLELQAGAPLAAEALYRRGLARVGDRPAAMVSWRLRAGLGRALHARGATTQAAAALTGAIADLDRVATMLPLEERRAAFLADKWDVYVQLALVERARGDAAAAFAMSERMRARQTLDLLARGRIAPPASEDSSLVAREQDLRRQIGELTERLAWEDGGADARRGPDFGRGGSAESRETLARAQERYAELLLRLREDGSAYAPAVRGEVIAWRELAGRLAPEEALIEYLVSDSTTLAFVLRPDTLLLLDLNVGRGALEQLIDFARGTLVRPPAAARAPQRRPADAWRAPLRRLHRHLIEPLEDGGALTGVRRLILVPHVELHYLPFAALIKADDASAGTRDEFLIERYEIGYAPSASVWVRLGERGSPRAGSVLALAPRTRGLPGSREEVEAIRALYGSDATVLVDGSASESAFRAAAPRFAILHLATYGVLNKHNPLFSYVSLNPGAGEDGRLEVHEVFGLALNARLLVLSACQTALASGALSDVPVGDDWVGLVRAFLGAGAANVIATLWPVEDRSTAQLMERLHRDLRGGHSEIAALALAQREALREPARRDPFYWAGFVLVGGR